uniref:E3 ubiquitin protein ligase n=1 Tax=Blastobotrys adeninivorans TaxID=409370 RepID=A0A060T4K2_BLAAD
MEDKKRGPANFQEPAPKRPLVDSGSANEPLSQEDVVQFQKEAIFRQMGVYKRECSLLQSKLDTLDGQFAGLQRCFSALDTWWDKLLDSLLPEPSSGDGSEIPESLLLIATKQDSEKDAQMETQFNQALTKKEEAIKNRLGPLLKQTSAQSPDASKLQDALTSVSGTLNQVKAENDALKLTRETLTRQLEEVTEKYLASEKKLERLLSPTLTRIEQSAHNQSNGSTTDSNGSESADADNKPTNSNDKGVLSAEVAEELEKTKNELLESKAVITKQKEQLDHQETQIVALKQHVDDLSSRLHNLSEEDVQQSPAYQSLKLNNSELKQRASRAEADADRFYRDKKELLATREEYTMKVKKDYEAMKDDLERQMSKLEQDVTRIRSVRDEILGELNVKKAAEAEKAKGMSQLEDLLSIREKRIKTLEDEIKRLRDEGIDTNNKEPPNTDGATPDELKQLVQKLHRQNVSLSAELPGMEQLYSQAHAKATAKVFDVVEREAKMNKLTIEKTKADEKYFAAMRAKDALGMEMSKIKTQLAKSTDVIQHLKESERHKSHKISTLEKQLQEVESARLSFTRDLQSLRAQVDERDHRVDAASKHIQKLREDLKAKDGDVRKEVEARRGLEIEVEKLRRQVDTKRMTTFSGNSSDAEEQMEALRSIALCSLCSKNWKDTAIKVCGHVFCNDCAKDRLNARLRKCPMCNKQYSFNDLLPVHL